MAAVDNFVLESRAWEDGGVSAGKDEEGEGFGEDFGSGPGVEHGPLVGPEQPAEVGLGFFHAGEVGGGLPRIRGARLVEFPRAELGPGERVESEAQHGDPVVGGGGGGEVLFMGRLAGGEEDDFFEVGLAVGSRGEGGVSEVDGVERSSEEAEPTRGGRVGGRKRALH